MVDAKGRVLKRQETKKITILKNKEIPYTNIKDSTFSVKIDRLDPVFNLTQISQSLVRHAFKVSKLDSYEETPTEITFSVILNENGKEPSELDLRNFEKGVISLYKQTYTFDIVYTNTDFTYHHFLFWDFNPYFSNDSFWEDALEGNENDCSTFKPYVGDWVLNEIPMLDNYFSKHFSAIYPYNDSEDKLINILWNSEIIGKLNVAYQHLVPTILKTLNDNYENSGFFQLMQKLNVGDEKIKEVIKWLREKKLGNTPC